jgi:hypothetical protein
VRGVSAGGLWIAADAQFLMRPLTTTRQLVHPQITEKAAQSQAIGWPTL